MAAQIIGLQVSQVRIFQADALPFAFLQLNASVQRIMKEFEFRQAATLKPQQTPDLSGGVAFFSGAFQASSMTIVIQQLILEKRRIILNVAGSSGAADLAFSRLRDLVKELDQRENKAEIEPLVQTDETTTIVKLDLSIAKIFSTGQFASFSGALESKLDRYGTKETKLVPISVRYRVAYGDLSDELKANNIALLAKEIVIELREGTPLEDNTFFIVSPNRSDLHLEIVSLIEQTFSEKSRQ